MSNARLCCEFRPDWVVKLDDPPQELPAVFRHTPATCARDLGHQTADVESFEQAPLGRARTPSLGRLQQPPEQRFSDVAVAEATRDVVAIQDRLEKSHIVPPRGVEARVAAAVNHLGLGQVP